MGDGPADVFLDLAACLEQAGEQDAAAEAFAIAEAPPLGASVGAALRGMEDWIPPESAHAWKCLTVARKRVGRRPALLARRTRDRKVF